MALEYFDMALVLDPLNPYFLSDKGSVLLSINQHEQAETQLKKSLEILPKNTDALNGLANVYAYKQDYEKEILHRQAVLIVQPDNQEAMIGIGNALVGLKKFDEAILQYDEILKMNNVNINAIIGKANALSDLKEYYKSIEQYDHALSINPYNINALTGKSIVYVNLGEYEKAIKIDEMITKLKQQSNQEKDLNLKNNEKIPLWIKNVFGWYHDNKVSEDELISALKFLIEKKIIILD